MTAADLQRTPLFDLMADYNARMTAFSGWEMPVQFSGLTQEHQIVRSAAGMFDISHMGKFRLHGSNVLGQLQKLVPSDLARLQPGQAQYTVLLNPQGGIIDDVIFTTRVRRLGCSVGWRSLMPPPWKRTKPGCCSILMRVR